MGAEVQQRDGLYGFEFRDADERRAAPGERKTYDIKQMWQRTHEICNLSARGFKNVDIARIVGCTPETVSNTLNSTLGKDKLATLRESRDDEAKRVSETIRVLTEKALDVYNEILDNESGAATLKDRKDVADTVTLELSGLRAPTRVQSVSTVLTAEELEEFKRRGREVTGQGEVIDVEATEEATG